MVCGYIRNKVSINLAPFRFIKLYYYNNFTGYRWGDASPGRIAFYKANNSKGLGTYIKSVNLIFQDTCYIDVSDINEQVFFTIGETVGPGTGGYSNGTVHITRIDFLTS